MTINLGLPMVNDCEIVASKLHLISSTCGPGLLNTVVLVEIRYSNLCG